MLKFFLLTILCSVSLGSEASESKIIKRDITFKGVKMQSSPNEFLANFPEAKCQKKIVATICEGGAIEYLKQNNAMYSAFFYGNIDGDFHKLSSVTIAFFSEDIAGMSNTLKTEISNHFGAPEKINDINLVEDDISSDIYSWSGNNGDIVMSVCKSKSDKHDSRSDVFTLGFNRYCPNKFVYVRLQNKKKITEKSPNKDF